MESSLMYEGILAGLAIKPIQFLFGAAAIWISLRFLNKSAGISFKVAYAKISENPVALAIFHGLQLFAAAYLYGSILG